MTNRRNGGIRPWPVILATLALSGVPGMSLAQTITTRSFTTNGKYWISLPASPRPAVTNAEELLGYGPFATVERFRTEDNTYYRWDGATCCNYDGASGACTPGVDPASQAPDAPCSTGCFCVIPGEGYQVTVTNAPQTWNITGYDGVTISTLKKPLAGASLSGYNLISLPIAGASGFQHAADLYTDINFRAGASIVQAVTRINANGSFTNYTGVPAINNFPFVQGEGYRVQIRSSAPAESYSYTPPQSGSVYLPCIEVPINGTVKLPPENCAYLSPSQVHVFVEGLPPGTQIELGVSHEHFFNITTFETLSETAMETFDSDLAMHITGTGIAASVDCTLTMTPAHVVIETDPPQVGQPVQDFQANMRSLTGSLSNETSCNLFESLNIMAGTDNGLPSPGHIRLVRRPDGTYDVNSYFDVSSAISFVGKPGSILDGMSGTTILITRMGPLSNVPPAGPTAPPVPDGTFGSAMTCERAAPDGSAIDLHWDVSTCSAENYNVLYGPLAGVSSYALGGSSCALGTTGDRTWSGVPSGNLWFLIVAQNGSGIEGSWGTDSAGSQRNGGVASSTCGNATGDNASKCP